MNRLKVTSEIDLSTIDYTEYLKNPVVLCRFDISIEAIIGKVVQIIGNEIEIELLQNWQDRKVLFDKIAHPLFRYREDYTKGAKKELIGLIVGYTLYA